MTLTKEIEELYQIKKRIAFLTGEVDNNRGLKREVEPKEELFAADLDTLLGNLSLISCINQELESANEQNKTKENNIVHLLKEVGVAPGTEVSHHFKAGQNELPTIKVWYHNDDTLGFRIG